MKKQLLFLVMMLLPMIAHADKSGTCGDNLTWTLNESTGNLTIEGSGTMTDYSSSSNAPWYRDRTKISNVVIGDGVTNIGQYAFYYCPGLTSITIPNSVTSIGNEAFSRCPGLTSITIPNSVTSIGDGGFSESGLTSITISNSVKSIGQYAFYRCYSLTSITIPNSVTSIGGYAFSGCYGLTSITIGNGVKSIGERAFELCSGLRKVIVSDIASWCGIKFGGNWANPLVYAKHLYSDENAEIKDLVIPNNVTSIGNYAFYSCLGLTSVTIGNSVTSIGDDAFSHCSGLTSVTIPNSVTSIGNEAFFGCSGLTSVTIPNSVTSIGNYVFSGCSGLTAITIGYSMIIGKYAFEGCSKISNINILVTDFGAFCNNNIVALIRYEINTSPKINLIDTEGKEIQEYVVPNSVISIGNYAFYYCSGLTSVIIPNSVTSIGNYAFESCSGLTSVIIPNSVTSIGNYAFESCSGLTSVTIGISVTSIGKNAFSGCSGLTSITIPNSVTSIDNKSFDGCRLENVLAKNSKTACSQAFNDRTYQHAMLYIPEGTWGEAVYDGDWYMFNNIREIAMNTDDLSSSRAYTLMDTNNFGYAVCNGTNSEVKMAKAFYSIDENDLNNCWQVIDKSGTKYLYNVGAKKYAKITSDGKITLTDNEMPINITEGKNGLMFGSDASREWGLVKNNNVNIDSLTGINPVSKTYSDSNSTYFTLDGQQTTHLKKGLNIVKMSDGKSVKVMMK